jgi:hypothetical protein
MQRLVCVTSDIVTRLGVRSDITQEQIAIKVANIPEGVYAHASDDKIRYLSQKVFKMQTQILKGELISYWGYCDADVQMTKYRKPSQ